MGDRMRTFESGETPHENNYTEDGSRIFHASIGKVYTPGDDGSARSRSDRARRLKGDRWFQIVRNSDFAITQRWDMGKELAEAGYPDMSSAVRPMAIAPDERFVYFQVSYFHGLVEFDTQAKDIDGQVDYTAGTVPEPRTGAVRRVINLPNRVPTMPRGAVRQRLGPPRPLDRTRPVRRCAPPARWTTTPPSSTAGRCPTRSSTPRRPATPTASPTGRPRASNNTCWISLSADDSVAVLDFAKKKEVAYLSVGDHPQRIRQGVVSNAVLAN